MIRATSLAIVAALAGGVLADPIVLADDAPPVDPVAVAGRYQTKLTWTHCDPAGAKAPIVTLSPIDSRLELDLATARDGLGVVVVAGDSRRLTGTIADVTATLAFDGAKTQLFVELTSGCQARGTIKRIASGIAPCDELVALARIETGCGSIAADARREDVAGLDELIPGWSKARGATKREAAATCQDRVDQLRPALVDAACLAVAVEDQPTTIAECRDLAQHINALMSCRVIDAQTKAQLRDMLPQISVQLVHADAGSVSVARQVCLRQDQDVKTVKRALGCP